MVLSKSIAGIALAASFTLGGFPAIEGVQDPVTRVEYTEVDGAIANPERGFYAHRQSQEKRGSTGYVALTATDFGALRAAGTTQVLRIFYMEQFVNAPLSADWLELVRADFRTARAAGISLIVRFAYLIGPAGTPVPPYGDASSERALEHIGQLAPIIRENADVIAVMQAGFVGLWGEWFYTDGFLTDPKDPDNPTSSDWAKRRAVVDALLAALPADRSVQVRTPQAKQKMFGVPSGTAGAITSAEAFTGTPLARTGHHNDCFLASETDFGTYKSSPLSLDQDYLAAETASLAMGGETCAVDEPRSLWPTAEAEMARYHYSYLNAGYNEQVLASWGSEGIAEATDRLGYRLVMTESRLTAGAEPTLEIDIANRGWAAPYNPRPVRLVLDGTDGSQRTIDVKTDVRRWAPGSTQTLAIPLTDLPDGTYTASLALPAAAATTAGDPRYSIRLANAGTWNADRGINTLGQTVSITTGQEVSRVSGEDRFLTAVAVSERAYPAGTEEVFLASGAGFADALSAGPAAASRNAPVLLTARDHLPAAVSREITRLGAERVVVAGGPGAVSDAVLDQLREIVPSVKRVSGADRFATSRAIAEFAFTGAASEAIVATGLDFPDALSAGAAMGTRGPVVLVDGRSDTLDDATAATIRTVSADRLWVAGGERAVSAAIAGALGGIAPTTRLSGGDRYATSAAVNETFFPQATATLIATGTNFPDALAGTAWAPVLAAPLAVVPGTCIPAPVLDDMTARGTKQVILLGGERALSPAVAALEPCR